MSHSKTSQIRLLDIATGKSTVILEDPDYSEPVWVSETEFIFLHRSPGGVTTILEFNVADEHTKPREVAMLPGLFGNIKVKPLTNSIVAIACSVVTKPDGTPYNPAWESKKHSSGKTYSDLFVRHWDSYVTENKNSLWYGRLEKTCNKNSIHNELYESPGTDQNHIERDQKHPSTHPSAWKLAGQGLTNLLANRGLESPVPPFGGANDFDLSSSGIAFVARDPDISPALYTKTNLYFVPLVTFTEACPPAPQLISTPGLEGYSASPVFSPCGKSLVFTRMRSKQYESDKPRLLLVPSVYAIADGACAEEFYATDDGEGSWDLRPEWCIWSNDGATLFVTAEKNGRVVLWQLPSSPAKSGSNFPNPVVADGSVNDAKILSSSGYDLFVTSTNMVDSSIYSIVTPGENPEIKLLSSNSKGGRCFGLSRLQFDEFWFQSGNKSGKKTNGVKENSNECYSVHALVMRPSGFDLSKKYPLAMLIHGGPQGAWLDGWSTRWNPAIFAEQGYIVIMPNVTGSTGYGMDFQDGIQNNWGGRPYCDIMACFNFIEKSDKFNYVDTTRAVALGASYGGYMINWIQGHPLGRKFKALVCHDGVFSTLSQFCSEELYFPIHDFGGTLWDNRHGYEMWDPSKYTSKWETPQLVSARIKEINLISCFPALSWNF